MTKPLCVLIGPPGSGKTSAGRALAALRGVSFRDTDADIEAQGKPIAEIFAADGEIAFRKVERAAVAKALKEHNGVLALGGGAPMQEATAQLLHDYRADDGAVIFLDVSRDAVAMRLGDGGGRPLLQDEDPIAKWTALLEDRRPVYKKLANVSLDTSARPAEEVAELIDLILGHPKECPHTGAIPIVRQ
jgi:shikimate kinase